MEMSMSNNIPLSVTYLSWKSTNAYPYTHRIELPTDLVQRENIKDWLQENDSPVTIAGDGLYIREEWVSFFLLKWK
jgi:hypothetical protein